MRPVAAKMENRDTLRKPRTLACAVVAREEGEDMAAEPVPVLRPGVTRRGVEDTPTARVSTASQTGSRKIGSNLASTNQLIATLVEEL